MTDDEESISFQKMIEEKLIGMAGGFGDQILRGGGRCEECTCKHGWSACQRLSMHDPQYHRVCYRENQT